MEYYSIGNYLPFAFEPNGILLSSFQKKIRWSARSYSIQFGRLQSIHPSTDEILYGTLFSYDFNEICFGD